MPERIPHPPHPFEKPHGPAAEYSRILGLNVIRLRRRARLNKKTFCLMAGISRPFLDKVERGLADPQVGMLVRMASTLGVTPADLLIPPFDDVPLEAYAHSRSERG